jgi:hypothetical protein
MTVTEKLEEAYLALHKLMTGQALVSISHAGRQVSYAKTEEPQLRAYIKELEAERDGLLAPANRSRVMTFTPR